jgi:hypothetical protein
VQAYPCGISQRPSGASKELSLRRQPMEENVRAAKRAFDFLTTRHQPNQGGTDEGFLRLKDADDRAMAAFRHGAA